jgi:glycerophosphoryl diester phosphodiesterase
MIRQAAPGQRLLASVSPRSVEMAGGLDNVLDRFAALGDCLIAVEKGMLEQRFDFFLERVGGERLGVWSPNEPAEIAAWLRRPIREITTDRPDIALSLRVTA